MKELKIILDVKKDQPVTDSLIVAKNFGKEHKNVLKLIDSKINNTTAPKVAVVKSWFFETTYKNKQGKKQRKYLMNKDGFSYIVMGFTGKKADEFKIAYINEFNRMTEVIKEHETQDWKNTRINGKQTRSILTETLQQLATYAKAQNYKGAKWTYSQYTKLVNKALGIKQNNNTRDCCTSDQLHNIKQLEESLSHVINDGMKHNAGAGAIYKKCKQYCNEYLNMLFKPSPFKPAELR